MTELAFPDIADEVIDAAPTRAVTLVNLRADALAELSAFERGMAKLHAEHGSTDYDITTPFGLKLATTRRHAIRLVRYAVPKAVKAKRAELNEIRDAVGTEGERIEAMLQAMEDSHDILIKAEEARKAAIAAEAARVAAEKKAEAERIDAERREKHEAGLSTIRSYLTRCQGPGMTAERIAAGIAMLEAVTVGADWEEYEVAATTAQGVTLTAMRDLYAAALVAEEDARQREAQRLENARVAAELAAERQRIADEAAAVKAQAAELQRKINEQAEKEAKAERDAAAVLAAQRAESERLERLAVAQREAAEHAELEAQRIAALEADAPKPADAEIVLAEQVVDTYLPPSAPAVPYEAPPFAGFDPKFAPGSNPNNPQTEPLFVSLAALCDEVDRDFFITAAFVSRLGINPSAADEADTLYSPAQRSQILRALAKRLELLA